MGDIFPVDASVHGGGIDRLFWLATWLTLPAFLGVVAILAWCVHRYRERPGHRAEHTHGNSRGALGLTLALTAVVFVGIDLNLAWHDHEVFEKLFASPPDPSKALRIRVVGEQFLWTFRYAGQDGALGTTDDVIQTGEVHIPTGRPVLFELRSRDVIHSFFLPNLRIKQDIVPGLTTYAYSEARLPGSYEVMCAQLCGFGHYAMKGRLVIETPEEFDAWLKAREAEFGHASR